MVVVGRTVVVGLMVVVGRTVVVGLMVGDVAIAGLVVGVDCTVVEDRTVVEVASAVVEVVLCTAVVDGAVIALNGAVVVLGTSMVRVVVDVVREGRTTSGAVSTIGSWKARGSGGVGFGAMVLSVMAVAAIAPAMVAAGTDATEARPSAWGSSRTQPRIPVRAGVLSPAWRKARTMTGSNCVPALSTSSLRANSIGCGFL